MTGQERKTEGEAARGTALSTPPSAPLTAVRTALLLSKPPSQDSSPLPPPTQDTDVGSGHGKDNAISTVSKVPSRAEAREGVSEVGWGVQHFTE